MVISDKTKGIFWMLISVLGFTFMGIAVKYLPRIPTYEKVFFRNSVSFISSAYILYKQKESIKVAKENIPFVFGRSFFGFVGMMANFYALENLTMAEANMLNKLSPVFVTICACIFLKEKVDKKQVIGIILMLVAVVFVIKPSFSPEVIPSLAGLFSAVLAGFSYTIIRYLYGKVKAEINVFYFSLLSVVCTFPLMMMNFVKPNLFEIFMLVVGIGVSAAMGQFGLTYAYTFAPASEVSIYNYVIIITSMLMDYILFSTIPDLFSFIGGFIIMTTAIYLYLHNKKKEN